MTPTFLRRTLLVTLVVLSGCAVVFPPEQGPTAEVLASRYTAPEQRAAYADLHSREMERAINEARR